MDHLPELSDMDLQYALYIAAALVIAILLYLLSGWIMEKKLSV